MVKLIIVYKKVKRRLITKCKIQRPNTGDKNFKQTKAASPLRCLQQIINAGL